MNKISTTLLLLSTALSCIAGENSSLPTFSVQGGVHSSHAPKFVDTSPLISPRVDFILRQPIANWVGVETGVSLYKRAVGQHIPTIPLYQFQNFALPIALTASWNSEDWSLGLGAGMNLDLPINYENPENWIPTGLKMSYRLHLETTRKLNDQIDLVARTYYTHSIAVQPGHSLYGRLQGYSLTAGIVIRSKKDCDCPSLE